MKNAQRGFTLLELLISLALIGLMVVLLFGALRFGSKAWDLSESKLERETTISLLWRYLGDRFSKARGISEYVQSEGKSHFFFQGEPEAVEFLSPMPAYLGSGGLYIIRLQKVRVDGKEKLLLRRWIYHPEVLSGEAELPEWRPLQSSGPYRSGTEKPGLRAWYSESVLVDDLKEVRFAYFGLQELTNQDAEWSDTWEEKQYLPRLVRLRIEDEKGKWPEMIFRLAGA